MRTTAISLLSPDLRGCSAFGDSAEEVDQLLYDVS
jgi:predicted RNase H-like HicB family nuclease